MFGSWDPQAYKDRAQQWHDAAAALPLGPARDACVAIAEGYAKLVELIDRDNAAQR
jgi:hypothetical protein